MGIVDKMKNFIGIDDADDDDEDDYDVEEDPKYTSKQTERVDTYTKRGNVIKVHSNMDMKVSICEPSNYQESTRAIDEIKNRKAVVLNIESLSIEDQRQIFEFIKGAVYALEANIEKISKGIFVIAPSNIQIDGKNETRYEKSYFFGR